MSNTTRTQNCLAKLDRMNKTLRHEEADRVPISDFFWGQFLDRWRKELGLAKDTDPYVYYDLDWRYPRIRYYDYARYILYSYESSCRY